MLENFTFLVMSAINMRKRTGPNTVPWGTPLDTGPYVLMPPDIWTNCLQSDRNDASHMPTCLVIPNCLVYTTIRDDLLCRKP